jgi:hypothetical protein
LKRNSLARELARKKPTVAANRHPGQVGYSLSPPQEVRTEESSLRAGAGKEGEGQAAHAAACAARERKVSQTCRFFGVSRALFQIWEKRFEKNGLAGLRDKPRRPHHNRYRIPPEIVSLILRIREERRYGQPLSSTAVPRLRLPDDHSEDIRRHRVGRVSLMKYRPGPKPADAPLPIPGRSVQLDVKFVPLS